MVLTLVQIKEKLKPQLKELWNVEDFKITRAEHKDNYWVLGLEYQKPTKGPAGVIEYFNTEVKVMAVDDNTGQIETIL